MCTKIKQFYGLLVGVLLVANTSIGFTKENSSVTVASALDSLSNTEQVDFVGVSFVLEGQSNNPSSLIQLYQIHKKELGLVKSIKINGLVVTGKTADGNRVFCKNAFIPEDNKIFVRARCELTKHKASGDAQELSSLTSKMFSLASALDNTELQNIAIYFRLERNKQLKGFIQARELISDKTIGATFNRVTDTLDSIVSTQYTNSRFFCFSKEQGKEGMKALCYYNELIPSQKSEENTLRSNKPKKLKSKLKRKAVKSNKTPKVKLVKSKK